MFFLLTDKWIDLRWNDTNILGILLPGIDELLPKEVTLVHGPGCPVCVTPVELIDKAIEIAAIPDVYIRAQVSEGLDIASSPRAAVTEYFLEHGVSSSDCP